jgi:ribosomal protein S18 acetylase RimI-like enzyme
MLHVRSSNAGAISLYTKMGFVVEGVRTKQIKLGPDSYLDNIAMALWVGPF